MARIFAVVQSPRMSRKSLLLFLSLVVLIALLALASSLHDVKFEPGRPFAGDATPANPIVLPSLQISSEIPLWKILLFWALAVINIIVFFWMLPAEVRKRLLRQVLGFAVGALALILALRYDLIKLPSIGGEPAAGPAFTGALGPGGSQPATFHRPEMQPWMVYLASFAAIAFLALTFFLVYRHWFYPRWTRRSRLDAIADIAQTSLRDLSAGRDWGDVIIDCYARMNAAVSARRGLLRVASATPREFADRLTRAGLPATSVVRLTRLFEAVRYGHHSGTQADIRDATDCLNTILQACGTGT